ncbi:MAG: MarR family transcriptional regulator [Candidatus Bathyarchaeota archaeon]|nr:MarR family transcriptional regulator [Candidatus Bathyarchaeota archaeon]MDH5754887.1 MarR family transcriptional regulator [Candidatus Bathyarchaeota archaeon]
MTDVLLILVGVLLAATVGAAVEYYKQLRRVKKEYEKAKEVVGDIVLSFNRQLKREAEKLELVAYKVEAVSSKSDRAIKRAEEVEKKLHALKPKISVASEDKEKMLARLDEINKKVRDAVASQEALAAKISDIEEQTQQFSMIPEAKVEAVIPIKREKALAPLTETELSVLEMLAMEGPKTAPEIKDRIKLSREHTARLMKKLYEEGYLERDTSKIPFKYRIKKEMEKLLKKTESETT